MTSSTMSGVSQVSRAWLRRLPKAELHLHLEGTVSPETLVELSRRSIGSPALTLPEAESLYHYTDFSGFMLAFKAVTARLVSAEDYELITYRMLAQLAAQGVVHAEVYVSVGVIYYWRKDEIQNDPFLFEKIFRGMEAGRLRGERDFGVTLYWIFDAVRHFGVEEAARVFRKAAEMHGQFPSIIGIGIGGDERRMGAEPFRELYMEARDAGLHLTAHAGETVGPESIWAALNIGAERIGHGLTAIEDPELMEVLAERQIPIEICISSNIRTGCCVPSALHPVRSYFDAGLMITLNSDDPAMFESDLEAEYLLAQREFGFSKEHLRELAANSFEASFLPPEEKVKYLHRLDALP
jgi:adenosine deaminase/aminodeoxyfutalosine deaminase